MQRISHTQEYAKIRVVGVGGGGVAAVNDMMEQHIFGVDFLTVDTAAASIHESKALYHLHLNYGISDPNGAGGDQAAAYKAALIAEDSIKQALAGSDIVFILAGLGGGSGSGAAQVVARVAQQQRALVIGIVTYPFSFEGEQRISAAKKSVEALRGCTDTLVVIPSDRLLKQSQGAFAFHETYRLAHKIWADSVCGISELVNRFGLINVDFADVRTIMGEGGAAIITSGQAEGENRARDAAEQACHSELLGITTDGARGLLFNIVGGPDMTLQDIEEAAAVLTRRTHLAANVIFGAAIDPNLKNEIRITAVATGFRMGRLLTHQTDRHESQGSALRDSIRRTAEKIYAAVPA